MSDAYPCGECGMTVTATEYHPFAACTVYKATHDSRIVRKLPVVHGALYDAWGKAKEEGDEEAEEAIKATLSFLGMPWVRVRADIGMSA